VATLAPHQTLDTALAEEVPEVIGSAVPVALDLRGRLAEGVRRAVEANGWQAVDEATAALVPPVVRLTDVDGAVGVGTPTVLLVTADDHPRAAATACRRLDPVAIVGWPDERHELLAAVTSATSAPRRRAAAARVLRLGGAAGGVGTTTVALALAGLSAWRGRRTLAVAGDPVLLPTGAPSVDPAALAAPDLWARATPLDGVPAARAVRTVTPAFEPTFADPAIATAVVDVGVADDVDVLVLRPDAAGVAALQRTSAAAVVVVGSGPVPARAMHAAVGGRRRVDLPWAHRVARAALVGRVPAALPGQTIRALLPLVPAGPSG
jgi:hypothetical protein